jgi:D-alanyl-D-alanine carboxypeptidase
MSATSAGLIGSNLAATPELWGPLWEVGDPRRQRADFVARLTRRAPERPPGQVTLYSNAGYMVAGAVLEAATGIAWEDLLRERVFGPLDMDGCGFGPPARDRPGPWGHRVGADGVTLVPTDPRSPGADNPPALGPAGTVSCPLVGWGRFVAAHVAGARGDTSFLPASAWLHLHTPPEGSSYAFGWEVTERSWSPTPVLTHNGSNTMFYATVWASPGRDAAWMAVTNSGTETAARTLDTLIGRLVTE